MSARETYNYFVCVLTGQAKLPNFTLDKYAGITTTIENTNGKIFKINLWTRLEPKYKNYWMEMDCRITEIYHASFETPLLNKYLTTKRAVDILLVRNLLADYSEFVHGILNAFTNAIEKKTLITFLEIEYTYNLTANAKIIRTEDVLLSDSLNKTGFLYDEKNKTLKKFYERF